MKLRHIPAHVYTSQTTSLRRLVLRPIVGKRITCDRANDDLSQCALYDGNADRANPTGSASIVSCFC